MMYVDPATPATVFTLPPVGGVKAVSTHIRNASLQNAIRFVMERLPSSDKPRALIRTATHSIYSAEIEAHYRQPELRVKLDTVFDSAGRTVQFSDES
jgi:hypothetical protein